MGSAAIMSKAPVTVREHETVSAAAQKLMSNHFTTLPVLNTEDRFVGTFGIYELLSLLVPRVALAGDLMSNLRFIADDPGELKRKYHQLQTRPVSEFMNRNAPTLDPESPEVEAIRLFCRNHISLPVVDRESGRLLGIVSCWDAVRDIVGTP